MANKENKKTAEEKTKNIKKEERFFFRKIDIFGESAIEFTLCNI